MVALMLVRGLVTLNSQEPRVYEPPSAGDVCSTEGAPADQMCQLTAGEDLVLCLSN